MNKTTISIPKILISLIVYFTLPLSAAWLNQFVDSMTITYTLIFSAAALVLVSLNWDVFSLHLRRFTGNIKDGLRIEFGADLTIGTGIGSVGDQH